MMNELSLAGTKAETLKRASKLIEKSNVAELVYFSRRQWELNQEVLLSQIKLMSNLLIVRSSCLNEDTISSSNAGAYLSLLNVRHDDLKDAIVQVFESYGSINSNEQVLVQPMINDVVASGVWFSHNPKTGAPYNIINWTQGDNTTGVTSGKASKVWINTDKTHSLLPDKLAKLSGMLVELKNLTNFRPIDVEFAIAKNDQKPWLLQIRPLVLEREPVPNQNLFNYLEEVEQNIQDQMKPHPFVLGKKTIFGSMPDWNPAEIIGTHPKPLSLSLYRELITDSIWAYQRNNYGYRNLRSFPLIKSFFGLPMIDIRVSFNSFIPIAVNEKLADKLTNFYLYELEENPLLHDKIEFDIVLSCLVLDHSQKLKKLKEYGFSNSELNELTESLTQLTNKIINPMDGLWIKDMKKVNQLAKKRRELMDANLTRTETIYWLIEHAKRYGTLPFAGLARAGFIAMQMLQSIVNVGIFSEIEKNKFLNSLSTVSNNLKFDFVKLNRGDFLAKYGHLRPGTYDILSDRYDENFENYFPAQNKNQKKAKTNETFKLTSVQSNKLQEKLDELGLEISANDLMYFIKTSMEQRELSKFEFTKNLSEVLRQIKVLGFEYGLSVEELSYLDITVLMKNHANAVNLHSQLNQSIHQGKEQFIIGSLIDLPALITSSTDIWAYEIHEAMPNFITQKRVKANVCKSLEKEKLEGKIVCIPNADPGFDWLFSHNIAALITAWGGPNSHMAIRASEMSVPAVIGCGELLFEQWSNASMLEIDCETRKVEIIR